MVYFWQISVILCIVQAITNEKTFFHGCTHLVDVDRRMSPLAFVDHGADLDTAGVETLQVVDQLRQCQADIDNIFNHKHIFAVDMNVNVFLQHDVLR